SAEQAAVHMRQWQHAPDLVARASEQEMRVVPEDLAQDALPAGAMEERGRRTRCDESVPARHRGGIGPVEALDAQRSSLRQGPPRHPARSAIARAGISGPCDPSADRRAAGTAWPRCAAGSRSDETVS